MLRRDRSSAWIRKSKRWTIYTHNNYQCAYCGQSLFDIDMLTLDHLVPIELGGTNHGSNLVCACRSCNAKKAASRVNDFIRYLHANGANITGIKRRVRSQVKTNSRIEDGDLNRLSPKDAELVEWLALNCQSFIGA